MRESFLASALCAALFLTSSVRAETSADYEFENTTVAEASASSATLDTEAASFEAMSDEQTTQTVDKQATEAEQLADEGVKAGVMTPSQANDIKQAANTAREESKKKGFRKKLIGGLKALGKGTVTGLKIGGYAGEAYGLAFVTPIFLGMGVTAGVLAGENLPENRLARAVVVLGSLSGGVAAELGAIKGFNRMGAFTGWGFPIAWGVLVANNVGVCGLSKKGRDSSYCTNIVKINDAMTEGSLKAGRKGGSKVRRAVIKVFKRK